MQETIIIDIQRPTGFDKCHDCKAIGIFEKRLRAEALKTISEHQDYSGANISIHCQSADVTSNKVTPLSSIKYVITNGIHETGDSYGITVCPGLTSQ